MKSLLLVDLSNLYYCLQKQYGGKLDFRKLLEYLESKGYDVQGKIAYGSESSRTQRFEKYLLSLGFEIKTKVQDIKGADWDVGIAVDAMQRSDAYSCIIFATADGDLEPCLKALRNTKRVVVIGAKISKKLKLCAHEVYEITPELFLKENK